MIYQRLSHLQNGPSLELKFLAGFQLTMSNTGRASHLNGEGSGLLHGALCGLFNFLLACCTEHFRSSYDIILLHIFYTELIYVQNSVCVKYRLIINNHLGDN